MADGLQQLKHIVVLMMENRSFDHLLGFLKAQDPRIEGVSGSETNPDTTGAAISVQPLAAYHGQLEPDPGHHFEDVNVQIFGNHEGTLSGPTMQGFIKAYFEKRHDVAHSQKIMYCFAPEKVPVITTLARKYAVFNRWHSSIPGPTIPNRAFAHFGTSFGKLDNDLLYIGSKYPTIYERMINAGRTAKVYYYDEPSGTITLTFLLKKEPQLFGTFDQFQTDCTSGNLPDYSFIEPNYTDHDVGNGAMIAQDQHPDHNVLAGEQFIAAVYSCITSNQALWESTLLLILYDEHGGIFDHVLPPACTPDEFQDNGTGFKFDRLGIRVPAVLVSPWIPEATVVTDRVFDHASIPATVTRQFIGSYSARSPREINADTFLDFLTLSSPRTDRITFQTGGGGVAFRAMAPGAHVVPIDQAPANARQPRRPLSDLLRDHLAAVQDIEQQLPEDQQSHIDIRKIHTEAAASAYIQQVMAALRKGAKARSN
jgi:phospholipase C